MHDECPIPDCTNRPTRTEYPDDSDYYVWVICKDCYDRRNQE